MRTIRISKRSIYNTITGFLILLVTLSLLKACQPGNHTEADGPWSKEKAWKWYEKTGWLCGCNFQPSSAVNQLEMWQEESFDPATIERELGWAEELGFNVTRVYLHSYAWKVDPKGFKSRIDTYLSIADRCGIGTIFVFFDDCWNPNSRPGPQLEPQAGVHNSRWVQDPSCDLRADTVSLYPWLERYVKDVLRTFGDDDRVLAWDLYNEPGNGEHVDESLPLLKNVFRWAREIHPQQPLTSGIWRLDLHNLNAVQVQHSDIITYHNYREPEIHSTWIGLLKTHGRPIICTEYLARQFNSRFQTILPMLKTENIGAINWGLVAGRTNTIYMWNTPMPGNGEPEIWFTDILRKDGTAFDDEEISIIKHVTGKVQ